MVPIRTVLVVQSVANNNNSDWLENNWKQNWKIWNKRILCVSGSEWWWWRWRVKWRRVERDHGDLYIYFIDVTIVVVVLWAVRDTKVGICITNLRYLVICDGWERYDMFWDGVVWETMTIFFRWHWCWCEQRTWTQNNDPDITNCDKLNPTTGIHCQNNDGSNQLHWLSSRHTHDFAQTIYNQSSARVFELAWNGWPNVIIST